MRTLKNTFQILYEFLRKEERIMQSRISPEILLRLYRKKKAYILVRGETPLAFAALWPTKGKDWLEFGTLWIHPSVRGEGFASMAFNHCISLVPESSNIFLVTMSQKVARIAKNRNWDEWSAFDWTKDPFWIKLVEPWGSQMPQATRKFPEGGKLMIRFGNPEEFRQMAIESGL